MARVREPGADRVAAGRKQGVEAREYAERARVGQGADPSAGRRPAGIAARGAGSARVQSSWIGWAQSANTRRIDVKVDTYSDPSGATRRSSGLLAVAIGAQRRNGSSWWKSVAFAPSSTMRRTSSST